MVVNSYGKLATVTSSSPGAYPASSSISLYNQYRATYGAIYRSQPNVRICVEFLSRNIAQLGLHVFRRKNDTDRERLTDHGLAQALARPNPRTTRYRLLEQTASDFFIYWNAFWVKVRVPGRLGLVRLPAANMEVLGGLLPERYRWTPVNGAAREFDPSEIVHFRGYDPANPLQGLSPIETLRRTIAEHIAAREYRGSFYQNYARMAGVIERPANAPKWDRVQKELFQENWRQIYAGGGNAGKVAVLEDGMTLKEMSYSAEASQLMEGIKFAREEAAAAYHIPLPLVGILEHATFSNIKEQHKHLYQDCLGPPLVMFEEDIELQLLPEWADADEVYCEFNIHEKLKGSFEEQVSTLRTAVGKPFMSVNEGRARLNLPKSPRPQDDEIADPTYIDDGSAEQSRRDQQDQRDGATDRQRAREAA